ncbi:MoaD/ThiS family protein [Ilumatobacter nonamiensis]|uniref:MoaD/ThiS family protein n=1 Tax=Ilumatobacter nonamiensis TaxID=467093 RepID=UPI000344D9B5|nr:MoaD/ThiS family protein [Ilumatobacter nonamiensis]
MAEVIFAKAFRRHVDCPDATVPGATVNQAFAAYFDQHPVVRGYVLDEAGAVRKHVAVFVDDDQITDRSALTDSVGPHARIHVFQALSGG